MTFLSKMRIAWIALALALLAPGVSAYRFEPVPGTTLYVLEVSSSGGSTLTTTGLDSGAADLLLVEEANPMSCAGDTGSHKSYGLVTPAGSAEASLDQWRYSGGCAPVGSANIVSANACPAGQCHSVGVQDESPNRDFPEPGSGTTTVSAFSVIVSQLVSVEADIDRGAPRLGVVGTVDRFSPTWRIDYQVTASPGGGACSLPLAGGQVGVSEAHGPSPGGSNSICI
ncbi:MAG TPA: hypothetical protein VHI93_04145 [Candidatus Thermoplasmatota archaeon]|nr:hypothetical protein [Candidatus Thermoplasmatota archaeon]